MEKMTYNGVPQNSANKPFLYLSILAWLLLAINNLASLRWLYRENFSVWNIQINSQTFLNVANSVYHAKKKSLRNLSNAPLGDLTGALSAVGSSTPTVPLEIGGETIYKIFNFFFIISVLGCVSFIYKALIKKDQTVIDGMVGKYSKFHFFPLLLGFAMSMLGELLKLTEEKKKKNNPGDIAYAALAITLVGLVSMIFVYVTTNINSNEWWISYVLNRGTFSCMLILFWYSFCYDIYLVRYCSKPDDDKTITKWPKDVNLSFSIIFGIGSIAFSFAFKDIIICLINIYIYNDLAGKTILSYSEKQKDKLKNVNYYADKAIDYLFLICSFLLLIYIVVEKVKGMLDQMKNQIVYLNAYQKQIVAGVNAHTQSINQIANIINSNKKKEKNE